MTSAMLVLVILSVFVGALIGFFGAKSMYESQINYYRVYSHQLERQIRDILSGEKDEDMIIFSAEDDDIV